MSNNEKFYIDGQWVDPIGGETVDVINPATEEAIGSISLGTHADVDAAVAAALAAAVDGAKAVMVRNLYRLQDRVDW